MTAYDNLGGSNVVPEKIIEQAIEIGVAAITADLADTSPRGGQLLDRILDSLPDSHVDQCKEHWRDHPPGVIMGYPRSRQSFPCYSVTLSGDGNEQDYIGIGEAYDAELADYLGERADSQHARVTGTFTIFVYATHVDVCGWYYRVLRRIMRVATEYLISRGLDDPIMTGMDLAPDPRYDPENMFIRKLSLTVTYMENWAKPDALWNAFYADSGSGNRLAPDGSLDIVHEDSGGGIHPTE